MHETLLGIQKLLLKLWFSPKFSKEKFNFSSLSSVLDARLKNISPTLDIKRLPRSVTEHLKYWKANELRSFLLFYGIPSLYGILPDEYLQHYSLLVHAIFLLLQESVSEEQLQQASQCLQTFCKYFETLYGQRFYTLNVHNLLHLVDCVRDLGPLYIFSCFSFEDKNGFLLKLINGTQFIASQIITAVSITQKIPEIREKCIASGTEEEQLFRKLYFPPKVQVKHEIFPGLGVLGSSYKRLLTDFELNAFEEYLGYASVVNVLTFYNHIELWRSFHIYGLDYKRMTRRNAAAVKYKSRESFSFGLVKSFFQYEDHFKQYTNAAFVYPLEITALTDLHIHVVTSLDKQKLVVIDIVDIVSNCMFLSFEDTKDRAYICEFANRMEND